MATDPANADQGRQDRWVASRHKTRKTIRQSRRDMRHAGDIYLQNAGKKRWCVADARLIVVPSRTSQQCKWIPRTDIMKLAWMVI